MAEPANADKTLVMTATYNEIENLPRLVDEVFAVAPKVDFLVVDDNSPDGTGAWCDERAASEERLRCMHRAGKLGLGTAIVQALVKQLGAIVETVSGSDGTKISVTRATFTSHMPQAA